MSGYTTTPNLNLKMPASGADDDVWGTHWNQNALVLDSAVMTAEQADARYLGLAGGTMAGPLTLAADPGPGPLGAATRQYVDSQLTGVTSPNNVGRNLIHNSLFNVAQRGVGPFAAGGYTLDRWCLGLAAGDTPSVDQAVFEMGGLAADEQAHFMLRNVFTGGAGAGNLILVYQPIENVLRLANKTVTVSFWAVAAAGAPKFGVSLDQIFGTGGSPGASVLGNGQSVTLSTTWTRYSLTFTLPGIAGKVLGTNSNDFTELVLWYSSGATNATRSGNVGVQSGTFYLWGVQLELGSVMTSLEKPDPQQDLAKCQRFYQSLTFACGGYNAAGGVVYADFPFPVRMHHAPTTVASPVATSNVSGQSVTAVSPGNFRVSSTAVSAGPTFYHGGFTASADL